MPVISEIFPIDTVRIRPVEEAFRSGRLVAATEPPSLPDSCPAVWSDDLVNMTLVLLAAALIVLSLSRIFTIFPYLFGGIFRSRGLMKLEENMRLVRDRNSIVGVMLLVIGLLASRYGLYRPAFLAGFSPGRQTLILLGVLSGFVLLRHLLICALSRFKLEEDAYRMTNRVADDFLILGALASLAALGPLSLFSAGETAVRSVLYYILAATYLLFLLRRMQILRNVCRQLHAILYLCTLELLPAGLLVASGIFL